LAIESNCEMASDILVYGRDTKMVSAPGYGESKWNSKDQ
jgi:hypothetical protein